MKRMNPWMAGMGLLLILIAFVLDRGFHLEFAGYTYLYSLAIILFLASYFIRRKRR